MKVCPTCKAEFSSGEVFCPNDATRLSTPSQMAPAPVAEDPLIGTTLNGRYSILRRIGEGGMGIVYEAEHVLIEKRVALKVLRDDFSSRQDVVERFRQEAKSASRIGHENIVDISDFGETPSKQSYFVMEMLSGEDLANVLARDRTIPPKRACHIILQCCRALGAAHAKGIVHRDMKPENVFLTKREGDSDFVKLVDFGIAKMSDIETVGAPGRKLTKTGMIFGTPEYMSPEQAAGKSLDHRVDIYAVGVILFEMLTGRVPFVGDTFMGILTQHMFEPPPPLTEVNPACHVSLELEQVVFQLLSKDPNERFQSMDEVARAVASAMDLPTGPAREGTYAGYGDPVKSIKRAPKLVEPSVTLEMSSTARPRDERRTPMIMLGLGVALIAASVGGYIAYAATTTPTNVRTINVPRTGLEAGTGQTPDGPTVANGADAGMAVAMDASAASADASTGMVRLRIVTDPPGGIVTLEGRGEVCQPTPCAFEIEPERQIRITVRSETHEGTLVYLPVEDSTVGVTVRPIRRPRDRPDARPGPGGGPGGNNPHPGDLKQFPFDPRAH